MANQANGFIRLYRQITKWEWYQNTNTFRVFVHVLLMANFTEGRFEGKVIQRGQYVTSLPKLAKETALSIQQVRTALEHLISTGEITDKGYSKYRVITVCKYDDYQRDNRNINRQSTDNQQTDNSQSTDNQQQYKNDNKEIKKEEKEYPLTRESAKRFTPPTRDEILEFCRENGLTIDADRFLDYYSSNGWRVGKNPMKDWKATVRNWARKDQQERPAAAPVQKKQVSAQQYEQRDYGDETTDAMMRMIAMGN